jgi:ABC-type spermidine/putrescine transport system permease subunit II
VDAISLLPWMVWLGVDLNITIFNQGLIRLVIGHSIFASAVVTFIVRARMQGLDESLEEAAADLYAPPVRRFMQITLPLMAPAVLAGALMAFTLSLDNTIISSFVQVAGNTPWPVYVFSALRSTLRPEIAAVSTLMLMLTLFVLSLVAVVLRRSGASSTEIANTLAGG